MTSRMTFIFVCRNKKKFQIHVNNFYNKLYFCAILDANSWKAGRNKHGLENLERYWRFSLLRHRVCAKADFLAGGLFKCLEPIEYVKKCKK